MGNTRILVTLRFTPAMPGKRTANLQASALPGGYATLPLSGNGLGGDELYISPTSRNFGSRTVGSMTGTVNEFTVRSLGPSTLGPLSVMVEGVDAPSFQIVLDECTGTSLQPSRTTCRIGVRFVPVSVGSRSAALAAVASPGGIVRATLYGNGL